MLKIGLIGLGYLGKIHLRLLHEIDDIEIVGIYDIDENICEALSKQYNVKAYNSSEELIEASEAVDIVTPSQSHFKIASDCIKKSKHVFIEKPITPTVEEAKQLLVLQKEAGVVVQVGHVERFNPAFISAKPFINKSQYIEIQRLAKYNPRGTDVSVTLDLMIHDLDLLLNIVGSNVKNIHASGLKLISQTADIANARIEFENGCVANITSNRMSFNNIRKMRVFQPDEIVSIDLLDKITELIHIKNAGKNSQNLVLKTGNKIPDKELVFQHPIILPTNAIKEELMAFHYSIKSGTKPVVTIENAIDVLSLAHSIDEKIQHLISK